ncbi:acyl-CoA dehydrogenase NM domain-like protein [Mycena floridula]|nr:acyl-CoA dehydrogenase NM domain-like protein [Mycena floridula]
MWRSTELAASPLFQLRSAALPWDQRIALSYERAKAIASLYRLSADDVLHVSSKYWEFQTDPVTLMDGGTATLLAIHYNLCIGTIAMFSTGKEHILEQLLSFKLSGQYCLTELGHGLDVINLETTVTLLETGDFELNTPSDAAAKYMPPTTPSGIPCVSVVFARLIVGNIEKGVKPFLVPLHDGRTMYPGIISKALSPRGGGSDAVQHALTYFEKVKLPGTALLGPMETSMDFKSAFRYNISRVIVGTLSMGSFALTSMRHATYITARYSMRRMVSDSFTGKPKAIMEFSTQKIPVLTAISQTIVMGVFCDTAHALFTSAQDLSQKHFIAAIFKTTIVQHHNSMILDLGDRCGAQGLFDVNEFPTLSANIRGAAVAEGDVLGISIRFAVELLLGRVSVPRYSNHNSVLAQHEKHIITELRETIRQLGHHRGSQMESVILPQCQSLIEAVGHRLALEAAMENGVEPLLTNLYVASVIKHDSAWYAENAGLPRSVQRSMEQDAVENLYPNINRFLDMLDIAPYVTAPIMWEIWEICGRKPRKVWRSNTSS